MEIKSSKKELRLVIDTFKFYYSKVSNISNYVFKNSDSRIKVINDFIIEFKNITKSTFLQEIILNSYFDYQFNYWYKRNTKYGKGIGIQIEWIIGKKALNRWIKEDKKYLNYKIRKNLKTDVNLNKKTKVSKNLKNFTKIVDHEEIQKQKYLNTEFGLEMCILFTTLYNHKSNNCLKCANSDKCKMYLKKHLFNVYKLRGYE